jgi:RND family efflux transporter MFP subunit
MKPSKSSLTSLNFSALSLLCVLLAGPAKVAAEEPTKKTTPATAVQSQVVEYQQVSRPVVATGRLANKGTQTLSFKVSGTIEEITADEGQKVTKGQVLARLDTEETQARYNQASSLFAQSERDLKRLQSLYEKKVVPLDSLQDAETNLNVAQSNLDIAAFNLRNSRIIAPQDGIVLSRQIETNELVAPHQPAFVLSDVAKGWVIRTAISDKDIVRVTLGDAVSIRFDAYQGTTFLGHVSEIAGAAALDTLLFEVEVSVEPSQQKLLAGFIGHMQIHPSQTENIAWLPAEAVVAADKDVVKLFKVAPNSTVVLEEAHIAWLESGRIAVREGLSAGAQIVTLGATFLQEGERVNLVR